MDSDGEAHFGGAGSIFASTRLHRVFATSGDDDFHPPESVQPEESAGKTSGVLPDAILPLVGWRFHG